MKKTQYTLGMLLLISSTMNAQQNADSADALTEALNEGKVLLDTRLRYEHADQDGRDESEAFTARMRLGYQTGSISGF